jgi:hypothetical protein
MNAEIWWHMYVPEELEYFHCTMRLDLSNGPLWLDYPLSGTFNAGNKHSFWNVLYIKLKMMVNVKKKNENAQVYQFLLWQNIKSTELCFNDISL